MAIDLETISPQLLLGNEATEHSDQMGQVLQNVTQENREPLLPQSFCYTKSNTHSFGRFFMNITVVHFETDE